MDIEDVGTDIDAPTRGSQIKDINKALVFPKKNIQKDQGHPLNFDGESKGSGTVPGTQKIYLKTYGCSHNVSDSEYMEGILSNYGYKMEKDPSKADLWLLNSCTVKDPSQAAFMHLVNKAKDLGTPCVVAGCVSQADQSIKGLEDVSVVGISQIDRVVEVVEQTLQGDTVKLLAKKSLPALDLPKIRKNRLIEIIPLSTGCLGSCTYCKTKHARGKLGSYSLDAIISRAQLAIKEGVSEIWLSSEDTGAYGIDIGTNIAILLRKLVEVLPDENVDGSGGVMLRVGMTNPPYILEHLEAVAQILNHPKVFAFLHVPVQAGSNRVLDAMRREYTVEEYRRVVDFIIAHVPGVTIQTDIICGFPNETEADFDQTMKLIQDHKLATTHISQFYPRPGTPAAKMTRINTQVVKNRSKRLTELFESFTPYVDMPGQCVKVWFGTELSDEGRNVGHTKGYVKVLVPKNDSLPGKSAWVRIKCVHRFHVEGDIEERTSPKLVEEDKGMQTSEKAGKQKITWSGTSALLAIAAIGGAWLVLYKRRGAK